MVAIESASGGRTARLREPCEDAARECSGEALDGGEFLPAMCPCDDDAGVATAR
jgi:hypothetical protein